MKNHFTFTTHDVWTSLIPMSTPVAAAVGVTTLFSFTDYGTEYKGLALIVSNEDPTNSIDMQIDVSEGGVWVNDDVTQLRTVPPQRERMIVLAGADQNPNSFVRAQLNNKGASPVSYRYALLGMRRK